MNILITLICNKFDTSDNIGFINIFVITIPGNNVRIRYAACQIINIMSNGTSDV